MKPARKWTTKHSAKPARVASVRKAVEIHVQKYGLIPSDEFLASLFAVSLARIRHYRALACV